MKTFFLFILSLFSLFVSAQPGTEVKSIDNKLEGIWENKELGFSMVLMLNQGGSGEFNGESIQYKVSGNLLSIASAGTTTVYQFVLTQNLLTLSGGDLNKPISFNRQGTGTSAANNSPVTGSAIGGQQAENNLIGKWEGYNESLEFRNDGIAVIQNVSMSYNVTGNNLTIKGPNGTQSFNYTLQGDNLTFNINGQNQVYRRSGIRNAQGAASYSQGAGQIQGGRGIIAQELVGKWCYVNVSSSNSGGWSTDECITINGDGTYEYHYESSGSATGYNQYGDQTFSGGTAGQTSDRGTWRLDGNTLYAQSESKGAQTFTLQKVNHPKNGDPMIVINGRSYVTFYQKPGW